MKIMCVFVKWDVSETLGRKVRSKATHIARVRGASKSGRSESKAAVFSGSNRSPLKALALSSALFADSPVCICSQSIPPDRLFKKL
jgi:hypothetical protein